MDGYGLDVADCLVLPEIDLPVCTLVNNDALAVTVHELDERSSIMPRSSWTFDCRHCKDFSGDSPRRLEENSDILKSRNVIAAKVNGWLGHDDSSVQGKMEWGSFEPKVWQEDDVDIEISHCGICGSDLHMLKSGWGPTPYPCVVGHEIVGRAVKVGKNVKHIKVGDRVGVGAQARSCLKQTCSECSHGLEQHCNKDRVDTYGSIYPNNEGKSYGGYADYNRTNGHFVMKIPDGLSSSDAAPMLCGGVTVYSPLRNNGCGPGKTVGIVGVGGLGHFAVLFAKALGADKVVGISRKGDKRDDVLKLGADQYIATSEDKNWVEENSRSLDLIVSTVSSEKMPLEDYMKLLKVQGTFIQVGAPDGGNLPPVNAFTLIFNGIKLGGSAIGSPADIAEMLQLAADKKVKPWIQERSMKDANNAVVDMVDGKARYRYVLVNEKFANK
nr:nadp-dependent alcohol dehydrogenase 7 [Quercus suber]